MNIKMHDYIFDKVPNKQTQANHGLIIYFNQHTVYSVKLASM